LFLNHISSAVFIITQTVNCLADGAAFFSPPHMVHLHGEGWE